MFIEILEVGGHPFCGIAEAMSQDRSSLIFQFQRILSSNNLGKIVMKLSYIFMIIPLLLSVVGSANTCDSFDAYNWKDCGGNNWHQNISIGHISPPSLSSAPIENSGKSSICLEVKGPATASFWWKTDANKMGLGKLSFWINDKQKFACDSEIWKYESCSLRERRNYTLRWEFIKFKSYPKNVGEGWIDEVCITPIFKESSSDTILDYPKYDEIKSHRLSNSSKSNIISKINNTAILELKTDKLEATYLESNVTYVSQFDDPRNQTYASINEAIQHVARGGVVKVSSGTYRENIIINKPLTLLGENKAKTVIKSDNVVVYVAANDVVIGGFTILDGDVGIGVMGASNSIIRDNIIFHSAVYGIFLDDCINVTLYKNNISDVEDTGVVLRSSYGCTLIGNMISDATNLSVCIGDIFGGSYNNIVFNNTLVHSVDGIKIMSGSNWNIIGDGYNKNIFRNISFCDIFLQNCNKSMNSLPLTCTNNKGCKKCP